MRKLILSLALVLVAASAAYAADSVAMAVADGAIGTSGTAYRVKAVQFTCSTTLDASGGGLTANYKPCYGVLRNGTGTSNPPLLYFSSSMTNPTITVDYTLVNRVNASNEGTGVLFSSGVYYDEVTGSTAVVVVYEPKKKF